uniref:Uncharacterized protein n=1 Tax=Rhizophora mucronata TaxID=61149 RepID=A0A2P2QSK6_RHIMU
MARTLTLFLLPRIRTNLRNPP